MRVRASVAALFLLLSVLCLSGVTSAQDSPTAAPAGPPAWKTSCIYCPKRFDPPGDHYLAVGPDGRARLAYGGDALYYAVQDASGWQTETVDPTPGAGASLVLGLDGQPIISYYARGEGLKVARRQADGWRIETVDPAGDPEANTSLAIHPYYGYLTVGYLTRATEGEATVETVKFAFYQDNWRLYTVSRGSLTHPRVSLALDPIYGRVRIAYVDELDRVAYGYDGPSDWYTAPIVAEGFSGALSLALGGDTPHIMYTQGDRLYYAHYGAAWATEQVDETRHFQSVSLSLDATGQAHFVGHGEGYAWYGWREADGWHFDAIQVRSAYPNLAWAPGGSLRVAYLNDERTLELAHPGPLGGWGSEKVDTEERLTGAIRLAVDRQGQPQVAFKGHDVEVARWSPAGWTRESIFDAAATPQSIAVDSRGQPHLTVTERWTPPPWDPAPSHTRLWYAHRVDDGWQQQSIAERGVGESVLAVDAADRAHLAYFHFDPDSYDGGELIYWLNGASTILVRTYQLSGLALAVDSHDAAHLSYLDNSNLYYRYFDGTGWQALRGPDPEWPRESTAIALGADDQPFIAYNEGTGPDTNALFVARPGVPWQVETVAQGMRLRNPTLAFDRAGVLHLVYEEGDQLRHAWRGEAGWQSEAIAGAHSDAGLGLAVTPDGRLLVAYNDLYSNDARLAELGRAASKVFLPQIVR